MGSGAKRAIAFAECVKKYFLEEERPAWYPHQVIKNSLLRDKLLGKLDDNVLTEDEFVAAVNDSYKLFKGLTSVDLRCVFSSLLKFPADEGHRGSVDTENEAGRIIAELNRLGEQIRFGPKKYECLKAKGKSK